MQKSWKIAETLAHEYSSESTHRELSNEYQHERVCMVTQNLCTSLLWTRIVSAYEGLKAAENYPNLILLRNIYILRNAAKHLSLLFPFFTQFIYILVRNSIVSSQPLCCWWLIFAKTKWCKKPGKWLNPSKWVLIWEYLLRPFQWIPIWQGLDGFHKCLHPCASDESSLSIGRVKGADAAPISFSLFSLGLLS